MIHDKHCVRTAGTKLVRTVVLSGLATSILGKGRQETGVGNEAVYSYGSLLFQRLNCLQPARPAESASLTASRQFDPA